MSDLTEKNLKKIGQDWAGLEEFFYRIFLFFSKNNLLLSFFSFFFFVSFLKRMLPSRPSLLFGILVVLLVALPLATAEEKRIRFEATSAKPKDGSLATGEILYDTWGVPHIFADSFEALV